ncbi:hypothetical protein SLA2020_246280 [Shorea laevis]
MAIDIHPNLQLQHRCEMASLCTIARRTAKPTLDLSMTRKRKLEGYSPHSRTESSRPFSLPNCAQKHDPNLDLFETNSSLSPIALLQGVGQCLAYVGGTIGLTEGLSKPLQECDNSKPIYTDEPWKEQEENRGEALQKQGEAPRRGSRTSRGNPSGGERPKIRSSPS